MVAVLVPGTSAALLSVTLLLPAGLLKVVLSEELLEATAHHGRFVEDLREPLSTRRRYPEFEEETLRRCLISKKLPETEEDVEALREWEAASSFNDGEAKDRRE